MLEQVLYLQMMEVVSLWDTRTMWTCLAKVWQRLMQHTGRLTMRSIWNHTSIYDLADVQIFRKSSWNYPGLHRKNLANEFIQRSFSTVAAPILFAKKNGSRLWRCVDECVCDTATVKYWYRLLLVLEMFDRLGGAWMFTKSDLRYAYHLTWLKETDNYRTMFHNWYGQFEHQVMPFGIMNAPATFQADIDDCLRPSIDDFTISYHDDILICSINEEVHQG